MFYGNIIERKNYKIFDGFAYDILYHVRVAQLDRASGYGPEGREFESCHVHIILHKMQDFFTL